MFDGNGAVGWGGAFTDPPLRLLGLVLTIPPVANTPVPSPWPCWWGQSTAKPDHRTWGIDGPVLTQHLRSVDSSHVISAT